MGRQAWGIFSMFNLLQNDAKNSDVVKKKIDEYFVKDQNLVHECARFHKKQQMPGETVDHFMDALYVLADQVQLRRQQGTPREEPVCCQSSRREALSLQIDDKLTLATALAKARLKETVQKQELRGAKGAGNAT
ncbi:hypothetical protein MRX96_010648 [Rhipicephalus microplus]